MIESLRHVIEADQRPVPPPFDPFSPRAFRRRFDLQCQRDATRLLRFDLAGPGEPVIYHGSFTMAHGPALNLARCWCRHCRADARTHRRMLLVLINGYPKVLQHVHPSSLTHRWQRTPPHDHCYRKPHHHSPSRTNSGYDDGS